MFYAPIRHTPLKYPSDVLNFSCYTGYTAEKIKTFFQKDSDIFICNEDGKVFATPFREEIPIVLEEFGFKQECFEGGFSPIPRRISEKYFILQEMAEREKQLKFYEENFKKSPQRDSSYTIPENLRFSNYEITGPRTVGINIEYNIRPLFCENNENHNISTFIIFHNDNRILLCDEYGRTFLISFNSTDDLHIFVNFLLESNFSYTIHPEEYISLKPTEWLSFNLIFLMID